jgi:hypothetical protein
MSRLFWIGVGMVTGVAVSRRVGRAARQATPAGLAGNISDAIGELAGALGTFGADIRAGMAEREQELTEDVARRTGYNPAPRHAIRAANEIARVNAVGPRRQSDARARRADG